MPCAPLRRSPVWGRFGLPLRRCSSRNPPSVSISTTSNNRVANRCLSASKTGPAFCHMGPDWPAAWPHRWSRMKPPANGRAIAISHVLSQQSCQWRCAGAPRLSRFRTAHPEIEIRMHYAMHGREIDFHLVHLAFVYANATHGANDRVAILSDGAMPAGM